MKRKTGGYGKQGKIRNDKISEKKNKQWLEVKDNVCRQILIQKSHNQRFPLEKEKKKKKESLPGSLKMGRNQKMVNYTIFLNVFHLNLMRREIKRGK